MFAKAPLSLSNFIWFFETSTATFVILIFNYFILNILTLHKCSVNTKQILDLLPAVFVCLLCLCAFEPGTPSLDGIQEKNGSFIANLENATITHDSSISGPLVLWFFIHLKVAFIITLTTFDDYHPLCPLTLSQKMEAVRVGNYRDRSVNQAHPWLLLVNSHTHSWNSCKRTLLVWLYWSAYCNYVAFNCALLTLSECDALGPGTRIRFLLVDCSDGWFFYFFLVLPWLHC